MKICSIKIENFKAFNEVEMPLNLNFGKIKNTIVSLPPLEEQKAIVEKVNVLMDLCDCLEQEVQYNQELNEQLMKSVLREVFEGEKV